MDGVFTGSTSTGHKWVLQMLMRIYLVILGLQLVVSLFVLLFPSTQNAFVYANWLSLTLGSSLEPPSAFGAFQACHSTASEGPLRLLTPDGYRLGAWHIRATKDVLASTDSSTDVEPISDKTPFILFLHGNAATRALVFRLQAYASLFELFPHSQLLAIDYRGFGDSEGSPCEAGLLTDAMTAWDYVVGGLKVEPRHVLIVGQSLGTGVATSLTRHLEQKGVRPKALVLISAFRSIPAAAAYYPWMKLVIPLPLFYLPNVEQLFRAIMTEHFDSEAALQAGIGCPILWMHGRCDRIVAYDHSAALFAMKAGVRGERLGLQQLGPPEVLPIGVAAQLHWHRGLHLALLELRDGHHEDMTGHAETFVALRLFLNALS